jgi:vitamin B12 transporter
MIRFSSILTIYLFSNIAFAYSDEVPLIYISPNPSNILLDNYSGNVETIKLSKKNINFSLSDILKNKTSLSLSQSGGIASQNQLRIRGGEANHVLVLIDGIEVNDAASGSEYDFSHLFLFNISEIEILRGAYSNVHGTDAMNGVINIKTINSNAANLTTGSNNTSIKNYSIKGENKVFQYGVDLNLLESSGVDTSGSSGDRNRYENDNIKLNIKSINHNFTILYFDIYRQNDRDAFGNVSDNQKATTDINQIYSKYEYSKMLSNNIYSKQGLQYSINKNLDSSPSNGKWESITQSEKFKIFSNTSINFKNILKSTYTPTVSFGFEYEKINFTQLIEDDTYGDGNQMQKEYSGSFSAELIYPINNFQFDLSARRTINQKFSNNNTHRAGITYILDNGKVFFNHSTAFKNPTFTERYGYYAGTFNGNEDLKPESTRQYELGYSYNIFDNNINISQTYYNMKLKNEINGFVSDENGSYTAKNMGNRSHRRGLETKINYDINKTTNLSISHDYVDSTQFNATNSTQEQEVRRPKNIININYNKIINNNININTNLFYSSKIKDTDFSSYPSVTKHLSDYYLLNTTINFDLDNTNKVSVIFKNIFNRDYEEVYGYHSPGFEMLLNYKRSF